MSVKWEDFLKDIVKGENLDMETENSAFSDLVTKPTSLIFPPIISEIERMLENQSLSNYTNMSESEMDRLMTNWFLSRYQGDAAKGEVRMYFSEPSDMNIPSNTIFTDSTNSQYHSTSSVILSLDQMSRSMEGQYFYIDVPITAEVTGTSFNIPANTITGTSGTFSYLVRAVNKNAIVGGRDKESNYEFMRRGMVSIGTRDFACKWGIETLIRMRFPNITQVRIVGAGEVDMDRDIALGIHISGKADVFIRTISTEQKTQIIPSGTSVVYIGDVDEDSTDLEIASTLSDRPIISIDHIYLLEPSDINERTGDEFRMIGGFGMGGFGYGIFGQGAVQYINQEETSVPYSIEVDTAGEAIFTKFSKKVKGQGTTWTSTVKRGDRIQRTYDDTDEYLLDYGKMYTVSEVVSDIELKLFNRYRERTTPNFVNYRIQSYTYKDANDIPNAVFHVRDWNDIDTAAIRFSASEQAYGRRGRKYHNYPLEVAYTTGSTIKSAQEYMDNHINKTAGLDIMVKHFVPVYVDINIVYEGGPSEERMGEVLSNVIDRNRIWDPETEIIRELVNWNGSKWLLDISDIVDLFYNSGCTYVQLPVGLDVEKHYMNSGVYIDTDVEDFVEISPSQTLIARDITLTRQNITER